MATPNDTYQEDRKKALSFTLDKIEKDFGKGAIMKMGSTERVRVVLRRVEFADGRLA